MDDENKDKRDNKMEPFLFELPADLPPEQVSGLDLEIVIDANSAKEAYGIEWYAEPGTDAEKRQSLGSVTYVKPIPAGDGTTVSLPAPPAKAWIKHDGRFQLRVVWEIIPASPKRAVPDVELHIEKMSATSAERPAD